MNSDNMVSEKDLEYYFNHNINIMKKILEILFNEKTMQNTTNVSFLA